MNGVWSGHGMEVSRCKEFLLREWEPIYKTLYYKLRLTGAFIVILYCLPDLNRVDVNQSNLPFLVIPKELGITHPKTRSKRYGPKACSPGELTILCTLLPLLRLSHPIVSPGISSYSMPSSMSNGFVISEAPGLLI